MVGVSYSSALDPFVLLEQLSLETFNGSEILVHKKDGELRLVLHEEEYAVMKS